MLPRTKQEAEAIMAREITEHGSIVIATDQDWPVGKTWHFNWGLWDWPATAVAEATREEFLERMQAQTGMKPWEIMLHVRHNSRFLRVILD